MGDSSLNSTESEAMNVQKDDRANKETTGGYLTRSSAEQERFRAKTLLRQSSVMRISSSGIGTKLLRSIPRESSSGSTCAGTSCRMRSGRIESSGKVSAAQRGAATTNPLS